MSRWRIVSSGFFEQALSDRHDDLRERLRDEMPTPPRRINRFIRLALIGANRCASNAELPTDTAVYLASEHGPIADTVALMQTLLLDHEPVMPVSFINLATNMAGFHVARTLGLNGRNIAVARHHCGLGAGLELAALDPAGTVLLGTISEGVWPLHEHRIRCQLPANADLAEGSYWLALARPDRHGPTLTRTVAASVDEAAELLAAAPSWYMAPSLPEPIGTSLAGRLDPSARYHPPLEHCFHPEATAHALLNAVHDRPDTGLSLISATAGGYEMLGFHP